jgi:hypothetical protein
MVQSTGCDAASASRTSRPPGRSSRRRVVDRLRAADRVVDHVDTVLEHHPGQHGAPQRGGEPLARVSSSVRRDRGPRGGPRPVGRGRRSPGRGRRPSPRPPAPAAAGRGRPTARSGRGRTPPPARPRAARRAARRGRRRPSAPRAPRPGRRGPQAPGGSGRPVRPARSTSRRRSARGSRTRSRRSAARRPAWWAQRLVSPPAHRRRRAAPCGARQERFGHDAVADPHARVRIGLEHGADDLVAERQALAREPVERRQQPDPWTARRSCGRSRRCRRGVGPTRTQPGGRTGAGTSRSCSAEPIPPCRCAARIRPIVFVVSSRWGADDRCSAGTVRTAWLNSPPAPDDGYPGGAGR